MDFQLRLIEYTIEFIKWGKFIGFLQITLLDEPIRSLILDG